MATVMGGVGYGVYTVTKRYIYPMIAPPTPPQLEQDKAAIDASFEKAFALLEQLATDTDELKKSETARTERLDNALGEVESVIAQMKDASKRRDDEGRRLSDEVRALKDLIPRAMDAQKESSDNRLKEIGTEMKSLKTLVQNRMAQPPPVPRPSSATPTFNSTPSSTPTTTQSTPAAATPNPASATVSKTTEPTEEAAQGANDSKTPTADRSSTSSPYGRMMNGRAAIPAWQMAAAKKNQDAKEKSGTVENGAPVDGASASASA